MDLGNNQIADISSLSGLTSLTYLDLVNNQIADISSLSGLTSLTSLDLMWNQITDISSLSGLTSLTELNLDSNQITDISSLSGLTSLTYLNLWDNQITDISSLSGLTSLTKLYLGNNQIADISSLSGLTNTKIDLRGQKFTKKINKKEIELPQIFVYAQDPESKFYTNAEIIGDKCTYNKDTNKIIIDDDIDEENEKAKVIIGSENYNYESSSEGPLYATTMTLEIDTKAPTVNVEYSTMQPTNQDVTVTITADEEIQEVEGWTISEDGMKLTKTYSQNTVSEGEEITVLDLVGNEAKVNVKITNIDKTAPSASVGYSITEPTNQDVTVTITADEEIQQIEGWNLSEDGRKLTKKYTKNTEQAETIKVKDLAGNETSVTVEVNNIDKTEITAEVNYSTTNKTNQNVIATIRTNKKVKSIKGWELSEEGTTLTKTFEENDEEEITLKDDAGNTKIVQVKVENIDRTSPAITIDYSTKEITNQDVTVTITADELIQPVENWLLSKDGKSLSKIFNKNDTEEVTILDLAGNSATAKISVTNIDKTAPKVEIKYSTTKTTNQDVIVTITADEEIQKVEGWTLSKDGKTLTKTFSKNDTEEVKILDLAGNSATAKISVTNIDKTQNNGGGNNNNNTGNNNNNNGTVDKENNSGKKDDTLSQITIPKAGKSSIVIAFGVIIVIAIILRNKNKKYRDII